ncbi:hypothetical protein [Streptomyces sp. B6B3]
MVGLTVAEGRRVAEAAGVAVAQPDPDGLTASRARPEADEGKPVPR